MVSQVVRLLQPTLPIYGSGGFSGLLAGQGAKPEWSLGWPLYTVSCSE